jgi:hypothetical protein
MDARRSYYLAPREDDLEVPASGGAGRIDCTDIPYIAPANDDSRVKDGLSARSRALLRRLIALHSLV